MPIILGIESTAHTFGVGIVKDGKILSNVRKSFTTGEGEGGMIPNEVAKFHKKNKHEIYEKSLKEAKISPSQFDAIAFSRGPGLAPSLLEGMELAKELANKLDVPLVCVNHCVAHLEIGGITGAKDPVMLYASGANTQVISYEAEKYRVFGETLDVGIGNFIDTFARYAGLGFPGGPAIQKLAEKSTNYIELPYRVKGMDIALSGILTNLRQKLDSGDYKLEDLAYSLQETVFAMLVEVSERALAHTGKNELLLGGGVACNSRLQEMCKIMCKERGAKFFCPERPLLVDNASMIAYLGEIMFKKDAYVGAKNGTENTCDEVDIKPRERTDDVKVTWK